MTNPFRVKCVYCDKEDDIREMKKFRGSYYHDVKKKGNRTSCLQAYRDYLRGR